MSLRVCETEGVCMCLRVSACVRGVCLRVGLRCVGLSVGLRVSLRVCVGV